MNCNKCRLCEGNKSLMMGNGSKSARIMFVQESPYDAEYKRGQYMGGRAGKMLRSALGEVGIDLDDCYFTAVVKAPTPDDRLPLPDEIKACQEYLFAEIDVVNPDIIVPTGNISMKVLMGVTGITKHRGKVIVGEDGRKYLPILHPNMILKNPKYLDFFSEDVITLESVLNGTQVETRASLGKERRYCETYEDAIDEIKRLMALPSGTRIAIDLETVKANPFLDKTVMSNKARSKYPESEKVKISAIGFSDRPGYGSSMMLFHRQNTMTENQINMLIRCLKKLLERQDIDWTTQNGKFEIKWLRRQLDIWLDHMVWDTMLMHYLCITEEKGTHGLDDFSWVYTDMGGYDAPLNEVKPKGDDEGNYDLIDWDILKVYLADDCDVTIRVCEQWIPLVEDDPEKKWLWDNLMIPATYTLADIESDGVKVDLEWLERLEQEYPKEIKRIEEKLHQFPEVLEFEREWQAMWEERCAIGQIKKANRTEEQQFKHEKWKKFDPSKGGTQFNFGSPAQLKKLLFDKLGLKTPILTDKGEPSTNEDSLKLLAKQHPIAETLMEFKKVNHLNNNFVASMRDHIDSQGFLHGTYNIIGTVTGRLSSNEPNMQQMPRKSNDPMTFQYWHEIKKLFVSRFGSDGCVLQLDYSQLELRILAVVTQDKELIRLYREGADLHKATASSAFGIPVEEVTKDQRTAAKKIAFGIIYQESAKGLSDDLRAEGIDMSEEDCEKFIKNYFKRFPQVEKWVSSIKKFAKRNKYVKSMTGRIRHLPTIDSVDRSIASEALRQSVNYVIQSSGSDCTLQALIQINRWLRESGKRSRLVVTVHDSVVCDLHKEEAVEVLTKIKGIMEHLAEYNSFYSFLGDTPIVAEAEIGKSYGELFECTIEELEEQGVDGFIQAQIKKKKMREKEAYLKAEQEGKKIPSYVHGYWNKEVCSEE